MSLIRYSDSTIKVYFIHKLEDNKHVKEVSTPNVVKLKEK